MVCFTNFGKGISSELVKTKKKKFFLQLKAEGPRHRTSRWDFSVRRSPRPRRSKRTSRSHGSRSRWTQRGRRPQQPETRYGGRMNNNNNFKVLFKPKITLSKDICNLDFNFQ